jgi:hypothetical protein
MVEPRAPALLWRANMTSFYRTGLLAFGLLAACGGEVLLDPSDGAGGSGGGGAVAEAACTAWCEANAAHCSEVEPCLAECLERGSYLRPCAAEYEAAIRCRAAHPPLAPDACSTPPAACEAVDDAMLSCVYPAGPCEPGQCLAGGSAAEPSLQCDFFCGDVVYTSACGQVGSGTDFPKECTCQIDGETVGTCQSVTPVGAVALGCCSAYFAESE